MSTPIALGFQLLDFAPQALDLGLLRLHRPVARKRLRRIGGQILRPLTQDVLMHVKIPRCLGDRYAPIPNQTHSLNLELSRKLTPTHNTRLASSPRMRQPTSGSTSARPLSKPSVLKPNLASRGT